MTQADRSLKLLILQEREVLDMERITTVEGNTCPCEFL